MSGTATASPEDSWQDWARVAVNELRRVAETILANEKLFKFDPVLTSGGSSSGDSTPASITVVFDQNAFPLRYAGVNYQSYQIDSTHTALIKTGEE